MKINKILMKCNRCKENGNLYFGYQPFLKEDLFLCETCFNDFKNFIQPKCSSQEDSLTGNKGQE